MTRTLVDTDAEPDPVALHMIEGHAIVTGASGRIGLEVARGLAAEGLRVTLVGRHEELLRRAAAAVGGGAEIVTADLTEEAGITAVARACPDRLDVLVHAAGLFHHGPVADVSAATWTQLLAINLCAPMLLSSACLPQLRKAGGQVVFINSTAGFSDALGAYAASKHALRVAGETLRRELNGSGVRVLSVFPGRTDTDMQARVLKAEGRPDAHIPLIPPVDLAAAILAALAAPRSLEITDLVVRPPQG